MLYARTSECSSCCDCLAGSNGLSLQGTRSRRLSSGAVVPHFHAEGEVRLGLQSNERAESVRGRLEAAPVGRVMIVVGSARPRDAIAKFAGIRPASCPWPAGTRG